MLNLPLGISNRNPCRAYLLPDCLDRVSRETSGELVRLGDMVTVEVEVSGQYESMLSK